MIAQGRWLSAALSVSLVLFVAAPLFASFEDDLSRIDELHEEDRHDEVFERIEGLKQQAENDSQRAQLLWRESRAVMNDTDLRHRSGELSDREARGRLDDGEELAEEAISLDDTIADAYFWKGSNIGLRGEIRGVMSALSSASNVRDYAEQALEIDDELKEAYYLLGILYRELPGGFISFGDDEKAVEYGRRAVELHEREYDAGLVPFRYFDFYLDLAESLDARGSQGDSDEARSIVAEMIAELEGLDSRNTRQDLALERARELEADL